MPEVNIEFPDVFILCGGKGTRFRTVSENIPTALAPINGVPFLDLLLNDLVGQGCHRIILGTGYLSEQIESHIQQRVDAEYLISREESPLGTGGAIRNALPIFQAEQILIINGDSFIAFSVQAFLKFHKIQLASASILLSSSTKGNDYGNVELGSNHRILSFKEKSGDSIAQFINAGVYCLNKDLIKRQQEGNASIEQDWLPEWLNKENIMGMVLKKPFYDIGTLERFEIAQQYLA